MRIGINALFLMQPATGTGQHLFHLLQGLDQHDQENTYVLLSPRFRRATASRFPELGPRFRNVQAVSALAQLGDNVEKLWWEQVGLLQACRRERLDLLHCPYFASPILSSIPTVTTIHDVIPLLVPEYRARLAGRLYTELSVLAARRARAIIAVSECSKRDIERTLRLPPERIHVIGNAVDESYQPITDPRLLAGVRERYGIGERFILYFGGFDVRKNVLRLVQAYAQIRQRFDEPYQLVLAGRLRHVGHPLYPDPRPLVRELGLENEIIFTGQIREQDKAPLYSAATLFVFPSLYEGFGMPVLEAMACGAAVITSNRSALPEVAGDAAVLVDPTRTEAIGEAILELLRDPSRRARLGEAARQRARLFSWGAVAQETLRVYRQAVA
ncbi:MAG: glycosyltransferase family 4 protein [Chloroflexi bacterium]|nr:glycosyltransferase family 4 protein [Chloroflexota bacterium]